MSNIKFHTDPITGSVCAHMPTETGEESAIKLFWLGHGSTSVYVGRCMNEPHALMSRVHNPRYEWAETAVQFKQLAQAFLAESLEGSESS